MRVGIVVALLGLAACSGGRKGGPSTGTTGDGGATLPSTKQTATVVDPSAPANVASLFNGASDATLAPAMVYPPDGVLMPPNLSELEFQWTPAAGTTAFELHFTSTYLDLTVYTGCNVVATGCGWLPDLATWQLMSAQARGDTMKIDFRAAGDGRVGSAASRTLAFTDEDLLGGLYYWAAAAGQIVRYDFGKRNQTAEIFYDSSDAPGSICVGCHAMARSGTRVAVGLNAPVPTAGMRVVDVQTKATVFDFAAGSNFEAFSPDGSRVLANSGADLQLLDASSGNPVGTNPVISNGNLPDWSADGTSVVFARNGSCPFNLCDSDPGVEGATLYTVPVSGDSFGMPTPIVSGGGNNYYPSFSPDGNVIAFNRSASGASSYDAPDATVWVVSAQGGNPVPLTNATSTVGDSWPKFAPYSHHFGSDTIFWVTFSSRRDYGLRLVNSDQQVTTNPDGSTNDPRIPQVWMVAVPASAIDNGMPAGGYPAFWLPFQSLASGNHVAQWTATVPYQPCSCPVEASCCPSGQTCTAGECTGAPIQ